MCPDEFISVLAGLRDNIVVGVLNSLAQFHLRIPINRIDRDDRRVALVHQSIERRGTPTYINNVPRQVVLREIKHTQVFLTYSHSWSSGILSESVLFCVDRGV